MTGQHYDILIVGGGIIGSAVAFFLARTGRAGRVAVVEPDPTYEHAATPRANGGIRRLFSLAENIEMAAFGLAFFRDFDTEMAVDGAPPSIGFRRQGYLFVSDAGDHATMAANHRFQVAHGVDAEALDPPALKRRFPSLRVDDLAMAVHSPNDAWIDPQAALAGFRRKARALGVDYVKDRVTAWRRANGMARDVVTASGAVLTADAFVLAAGPWSGEVAGLIGLDLPVAPLARETHFFRTDVELEPLPFIKSETDLAFRPEGVGFAGGVPNWSRDVGWCFDAAPDYFESTV